MHETLQTPPASQEDIQRAIAGATATQIERQGRGLPFDAATFEADVEEALEQIRSERS